MRRPDMRGMAAVLVAALAIAGIAAGCGRKGALEPPPGYSAPAQTDKTDKTGENDKRKPEDE